jgi:hypothetical protein
MDGWRETNGLDTDSDSDMNMNMDMDMHNGDTDGCPFSATYKKPKKQPLFFKGTWRLSVWSGYGHGCGYGYGYGYGYDCLAVP